MKLIVCVAENMGVAFNNRRLSRDKKLCEDVLELVGDDKIFMNPYSKTIFQENEKCCYTEEYLNLAKENDYVFLERHKLPDRDDIGEIILYRWNRDYPADTYFYVPQMYELNEKKEFKGKSHEKITREIYRRKKQ